MSSSTGPDDPDSTAAYTEKVNAAYIESVATTISPEYQEAYDAIQAAQERKPTWGQVREAMGGRDLTELLDNAKDGEEFGNVLMGFFAAVDTARE